MDYFSIIQLTKEPFSNSPDPEYFFQSRQHVECLQKLELSLRLRRGLNVVIGDVGTGKTTLCRQLIRRFSNDTGCETHLILDPYFSDPLEFLGTVAGMFTGAELPEGANAWQLKEIIKQYIFRKGVDENKTVILIIDEGQKIPDFCLEILREFLNFETNEFKLLQIAIFSQKEFENTLEVHANFADRINLYHRLGPLSFRDTRLMIQFRIKQSSVSAVPPALFTFPALWTIYRASGGYPRKIVNLCHRSILAMIIQNRTRAGWFLVRSCIRRSFQYQMPKWLRITATAFLLLGLLAFFSGLIPEKVRLPNVLKTQTQIDPDAQKDRPASDTSGRQPAFDGEVRKTPRQKTTPDVSDGGGQAAAIETAPRADIQTREVRKEVPSLLGRVALKRNETLWRLVEKVYGVFNQKYLNSIYAVNPQITDPNRIKAGQDISIPAIPAEVKSPAQAAWWVKVDEKTILAEAIHALRSYPDAAPPVRLVPYWSPTKDIRFVLVLRNYFSDEDAARRQLSQLSTEIAPQGEVLAGWEEGIVFFADPYWVRK